MPITLTFTAENMDPESLQTCVHHFCEELRSECSLDASPTVAPGLPGAKGDAYTLLNIFLATVSSQAAIELIRIFRVWIERNRGLKIDIDNHKGKQVRIDLAGLAPAEAADTLQHLYGLLGESK